MEEKIRHLEMIQEVINRMASNSFTLKGWAVTLVAGIFALSGNVVDRIQYLIIFIPTITFWILDAFYLSRERSYRELYKHVSGLNKDEIDFSMDFTPFICRQNKLWRCMLSVTEISFYLPLFILSVIVILIAYT